MLFDEVQYNRYSKTFLGKFSIGKSMGETMGHYSLLSKPLHVQPWVMVRQTFPYRRINCNILGKSHISKNMGEILGYYIQLLFFLVLLQHYGRGPFPSNLMVCKDTLGASFCKVQLENISKFVSLLSKLQGEFNKINKRRDTK